MTTLLFTLALLALTAGLLLSAALNISACAWGCPDTFEVYFLQASFFGLLGASGWVAYLLIRKKQGAANA